MNIKHLNLKLNGLTFYVILKQAAPTPRMTLTTPHTHTHTHTSFSHNYIVITLIHINSLLNCTIKVIHILYVNIFLVVKNKYSQCLKSSTYNQIISWLPGFLFNVMFRQWNEN